LHHIQIVRDNVLFPSAETLQMRTVQHDGFELLKRFIGITINTVKCSTSLSYRYRIH